MTVVYAALRLCATVVSRQAALTNALNDGGFGGFGGFDSFSTREISVTVFVKGLKLSPETHQTPINARDWVV